MVGVDTEQQDLADVLAAHGAAPSTPTVVLLEGVSMYLSREAVVRLVDSLRRVAGATPCRLALDVWDDARVPAAVRAVLRALGEPVRFGITPATLGDVVGSHRVHRSASDGWATFVELSLTREADETEELKEADELEEAQEAEEAEEAEETTA